MIIKSKNMQSLKGRLINVTMLLLSIICLIGLNTTLSFAMEPFEIHFLATSRSYTATMQINDKAGDVWQSVVNVAKKRNPNNLKIKKENKESLEFNASKITENDEVLMASLKVRPESETSCRLMLTATMGGNKPLAKDMKDMVTDILMQFCDEKGFSCKIVK